METININGYKWFKTIGDEGQDVLVADFMVDEEKVLGEFPSEALYDLVIERDTDLYLPATELMGGDLLTEDRVAFKFRKDVFTKEEQKGAYEGLFKAATMSDNRGLAAGPRSEKHANRDWLTTAQEHILRWFEKGQPTNVDGSDPIEEIYSKYTGVAPIRGFAWIRMTIEQEYKDYENFFDEMVERLKAMTIEDAKEHIEYVRLEYVSDATYASAIWSGIAGFYDRFPRIPFGRETMYTQNHPDKFEKCYPFARKLDTQFANLLPSRYAFQKSLADKTDSRFLIGGDTTFTIITVNTTTKDRNARMACHRDAGSLNEGFSNLTVIGDEGKDWKGGYLVTPEVRCAINVRPGDLLLVDNMRVIHGNTSIEAPDSGEGDLLRMSLIFYYREGMKNLGTWEYEQLRRTFIYGRRDNPEHPLWWSRWNGVSPGWYVSQEWYDWLEERGGKAMVQEYHPEAYQVEGSLEEFFG